MNGKKREGRAGIEAERLPGFALPFGLLTEVIHVGYSDLEAAVFDIADVDIAHSLRIPHIEAEFAVFEDVDQPGAQVDAEIVAFIVVVAAAAHFDRVHVAVGLIQRGAVGIWVFGGDLLEALAVADGKREGSAGCDISADRAAAEIFLDHQRDIEVIQRFFLAEVGDPVVAGVAEIRAVPPHVAFILDIAAALYKGNFRLKGEAVAQVEFGKEGKAAAGAKTSVINVVEVFRQLVSGER